VLQEAADDAARRIAELGRVDDEILRDVVDNLGTIEI